MSGFSSAIRRLSQSLENTLSPSNTITNNTNDVNSNNSDEDEDQLDEKKFKRLTKFIPQTTISLNFSVPKTTSRGARSKF